MINKLLLDKEIDFLLLWPNLQIRGQSMKNNKSKMIIGFNIILFVFGIFGFFVGIQHYPFKLVAYFSGLYFALVILVN